MIGSDWTLPNFWPLDVRQRMSRGMLSTKEKNTDRNIIEINYVLSCNNLSLRRKFLTRITHFGVISVCTKLLSLREYGQAAVYASSFSALPRPHVQVHVHPLFSVVEASLIVSSSLTSKKERKHIWTHRFVLFVVIVAKWVFIIDAA